MTNIIQKHGVKLTATLLLLIMAVEIAFATRQQSPSWDEGDHIFSGYMNWKAGEYDLNPEHPPLVKLIATLPLLPLHLTLPTRQHRNFKTEAYFDGRELLFRNSPTYGGLYTADTLLFRVHMAALVFGLTLGLLLFLATSEMFGPTAGLIALTLFVFDPSILAHAPFVATDTGAACGFFAAVYTLYRFIKLPNALRASVCGLAVGLAFTTKHSTVLLLPIFLLLILGELLGQWRAQRTFPRSEALRILAGLTAISAVALGVLWGVYSFRFAMNTTGMKMPTLAAKLATVSPLLARTITFWANHHLLPESYLYGLADVQEVGLSTPTYILGKVYEHGVWFYFPVLLSLKWTVGFLGLLALAIYAFITDRMRRPREVFFLALPAVFYLLVAIVEGLNIGVRHILPIYPFAFALTGAGTAWLIQRGRIWAYPIVALLAFHAVDSLRCFPNYIPYANTFWGGPSKTNLYFTDSATDWAQQLKWTKQWLDERNIHDCYFAYFAAPVLLPSDYGIPCKPLPTLDTRSFEDISVPTTIHASRQTPILVSYGDLNGFEFGSQVQNPYQPLFERKPDDAIVNSIAVFYSDVSLPDASAIQYVHQSGKVLKTNPQAALDFARQAVSASPLGFDANLALVDAYLAVAGSNRTDVALYTGRLPPTCTGIAAGDLPPDCLPPAARGVAPRSAFAILERRYQEMEPSAKIQWAPLLERRRDQLQAKGYSFIDPPPPHQ